MVAPDNASHSHQAPEKAPPTSSPSAAKTTTSSSRSPVATDANSATPAIPQVSLISEVSGTPSSHVDLKGQKLSHDGNTSTSETEHARGDLVTIGNIDSKISVLNNDETPKGDEVGISPSSEGVAGGRGEVTVEVPGVPQSSIQFQADWRQVRLHRESCAQYWKVSRQLELELAWGGE